MGDRADAPALAVIVPADGFADVAELVERLCAQTIAGRIELVVPTPAPGQFGPDRPEAAALGRLTAVPVASVHPMPAARAAGARALATRADAPPVTFMGETHSLPEPDWAERLVAAHAEGWRRVTAVMANGNPDGALSWAAFLLDYGSRAQGMASSPLPWAPIHNASYETRWFARHDAELERLFDGYRRYAEGRGPEPGAYRAGDVRMDHLNVSKPLHWVRERYLAGRLAGAARSAAWPAWRRALYVLASPLILLLLIWRERGMLARAGLRELPRLTLPAIVLSLDLRVLGEAVAHIRGPGRASPRMDEYELRKRRFTRGA